MTKEPDQAFADVITKLLSEKLKKFSGNDRDLNLVTCTEIYTLVFDTLADVFTNAKLPLTNESVNYVAQMFYDGILINGRQELDPNIFTQRAKLENIETKEVALLVLIFKGTEFAIPFVQEIKRRS